jgi:hypothetical protein
MLGALMSASLIASLAWFQVATAADTHGVPLPLTLGAGSTVWLDGTSSLHEFESRTSDFSARFQRDPATREPVDVAGLDQLIRTSGVTGLDVDIPVAAMRSGKSGLDKNMQKTLKADQFPSIRFQLGRYALTATSAADTAAVQAEGTLTVAGHERPSTLNARAYRSAQGVWVEGTQSLLMTDFGIRPPTMMLGALKVGDRVTVHYRLLLVPASAGAGPQSNRTN